MSYLDTYIPICEQFEGAVPHFYLDTAGFVTIGIGNLVPNVAAAQLLPLTTEAGAPAPTETIAAEFARVQAMPKGMFPEHYATPGCLTLTSASIAALLRARLELFDAQLQHLFPAFASWPEPAQLATLDMAYNLGAARLASSYPHFVAAAREKNFAAMANDCGRNTGMAAFKSRNDWTKQQFELAAAA